jgi:hypothetical protein
VVAGLISDLRAWRWIYLFDSSTGRDRGCVTSSIGLSIIIEGGRAHLSDAKIEKSGQHT